MISAEETMWTKLSGSSREGVPKSAWGNQGRLHRGSSLSEDARHTGLCWADKQGEGIPGRGNSICKDLEAWLSMVPWGNCKSGMGLRQDLGCEANAQDKTVCHTARCFQPPSEPAGTHIHFSPTDRFVDPQETLVRILV